MRYLIVNLVHFHTICCVSETSSFGVCDRKPGLFINDRLNHSTVNLKILKMNTILSRANAIFAFSLSVLAALTFLCFLSTVCTEYKEDVSVSTVKALV